MNEESIRTNSDAAVSGDETDWDRLRGLTDQEIEAAVESDPDAWLVDENDTGPIRGVIFRDSQGGWRWRLIASDGKPIADSPRSYADRAEVDRALADLRELMAADQARGQAA